MDVKLLVVLEFFIQEMKWIFNNKEHTLAIEHKTASNIKSNIKKNKNVLNGLLMEIDTNLCPTLCSTSHGMLCV